MSLISPTCLESHRIYDAAPAPSDVTATRFNVLARFGPKSHLRRYLAKRFPSSGYRWRRTTSVGEVLAYLRQVIITDSLFDENNPSVVLADRALTQALKTKAVHVIDLPALVSSDLQAVSPQIQLEPRPAWCPRITSLGALTNRLHHEPPLPHADLERLLQYKRDTVAIRSCADAARPTADTSKPPPKDSFSIAPYSLFTVSPSFRQILATVPWVAKSSKVFTYYEIVKAFQDHLCRNSETYFDSRSPRICLTADTALGRVFGVRAFHRSQTIALLRHHLRQHPAAKKDPIRALKSPGFKKVRSTRPPRKGRKRAALT